MKSRFEVITASSAQGSKYEEIMQQLAATDPASDFVLLRKDREPAASDVLGAWQQDWHHDIEGALRSFKYLANKVRASYDLSDPKNQKIMSSIDGHLKVMQSLKEELFDRIFKLENGTRV